MPHRSATYLIFCEVAAILFVCRVSRQYKAAFALGLLLFVVARIITIQVRCDVSRILVICQGAGVCLLGGVGPLWPPMRAPECNWPRISGHRMKIAMIVSVSRLETDHVGAITTLSIEHNVRTNEVGPIYKNQIDRLAVQARITNYLVVLAMRNTRSILREGDRRASLS